MRKNAVNGCSVRCLRPGGAVLGLVILLVGTLVASGLARAQKAQAAWEGLLRNAAGAPIAHAKIELASDSARADAETGADGRFRITGLAAGEYRLIIEAAGGKATYAKTIVLTAATEPVAVTLSDRGAIDVATLKEPAQKATGGEELSSQAVSELPLNKRDFSSLLLLAAGTMTDSNGATNFTAQFAINGQRGVEATFAMDDADISDPEMGGSTFSNFNVDAVEGIDSSSGWMPAEIGRGASGFTNIRTRSGASGFHGSIFEFVRNSAFDARNFFDYATPAYPGRIPPFRRNEFGFTNGGPVYLPHIYDGRKRTFYFAQYQGFRQVLGTTQVMPVPTAAERAGLDVVTYPDGTTDTLNVPVDPSIAAILARYPMPNYPAGAFGARTYATASKVATDADQFSVRIDQSFSPKDQFYARFTMDNLTGPTTNPDQTAIDPAFAVQYIDRQRNVVGAYTRTISPRLILESLISITRTTPGFPTTDYTDPAVKFNDGTYEAFNSAAGSVMQAYGNLFQGQQTVSYTKGSHVVQRGIRGAPQSRHNLFRHQPERRIRLWRRHGLCHGGDLLAERDAQHCGRRSAARYLCGFLSGSPFVYTVAIAPSFISNGEHIGPAAIIAEQLQRLDAGHMESDAAFYAGLRPALGSLHADHRASAPHLGILERRMARSNMSSIRSRDTRPAWKGSGRACRRHGR